MRSLRLPISVLFLAGAVAAGPLTSQDPARTPNALLRGMEPDMDELDLRRTPVVRAVERARDSVVSVYIGRDLPTGEAGRIDGQGSGVIIDASGLVITNWHVVAPVAARSRSAFVKLADGRSFRADLLSSSPDNDLALLQLRAEGETLSAITPGDSDSLMVGETVLAIGNPRGLDHSVTVGVLSSTNRSITVRAPDGVVRRYEGLLHTDAAINQGNSGGALLDITGKLIGINNAMAVGVENIGYAIPVNTVRKVFEEVLASSENLATVWFGLRLSEVDGVPTITEIADDGPADRAGLRRGDVLVRAGGRAISTPLDYARATLLATSGEGFEIQTRREDKLVTATVRPMSPYQWELLRRTGLEVETVSAEDDRRLLEAASVEYYAGSRRRRVPLLPAVLRVRAVQPDSPAAELELRSGDVIVAAAVRSMFGSNYRPMRTPEELADVVRDRAGSRLQILLLRDGEGLEGPLGVRRL